MQTETLVIIFIDTPSSRFMTRDWTDGCPIARGCHSGQVHDQAAADRIIAELLADGYECVSDF